ncbi:maltose alpha-D-glucosyltransferase/alpha-amylase [Xanthobacter flavus]|uniref:Maltokinase n=1 Tax=Xanthobacter flavus TaxID=281 RepID=A0A9W6FLE4_XANFL|nr:maltose alpha-D-glucosyltransferase [Xanthobacter flavus]MDR6335812.1 maltose alpha-D-glucosyltransferase/alpha-amylase [Xanthobacter flavus]GLI24301.1 alpha-amylase [Xanthobacter flavus]
MNVHSAPASTATSTTGDDALWYKDAVIYQLHVKSFFDANDDGIGDFAGLISKLDYIASLGVTCIWLLPFYPSPRRDDGYDISEYKNVHPDYGTMADARRFIREAHARGMRVITELVINHTSDQHPWFQRARRAKPGSAHRNFYVWSDNDQAYAGTRIIFLDTEKSNWTWDPVAGAYFWHRFYSHQPDLNFDNPAVLKAVLGVMRFWLDLGVDGLRLDAVPYLVEREGTSNENLPETHAILKAIRAELDAAYPDRLLLAEANMWPEDTQQYFGDGDECHMAFHFPLMPRMYMAIAQEDRFPITDIMRQTPDIPENCQWAIFLRNHDELTLEMVTDSERDYLWNFYAADRRARINLGIRRRLAPLLQRDRRRVELMKSLLLSMPGTPVMYYGDEIGMGDNIFLGDRDGVRTPMQWSPDRNGGFSKADPASLVLPPIQDPLYGFQAINVEAQSRDTHSLLNWTRKLLSVRRAHPAFGRGTLRFLYPKNRKVFAYLREHQGETLLCVANLSRSPQAVELDLSEFSGRIPLELLGSSPFPPIGQLTYLLTLPPYGFYWFLLATDAQSPDWHTPAPEAMPEYLTFVLKGAPEEMITAAHRKSFEADVLPAYLPKRRWFAGKGDALQSARVAMTARLGKKRERAFVMVETKRASGTDLYQLPVGISWDDEAGQSLPQQLALSRVRRGRRTGYLTDAFALPEFAADVMDLIARDGEVASSQGRIVFRKTPAFESAPLTEGAPVRFLSAEQSNSSLIYGDKAVLKLFRRITPGIHPEAEMSRALTERGFANTATLLGEIVHEPDGGAPQVLAVLQAYVAGEGDAWTFTLSFLQRAADEVGHEDIQQDDLIAPYLRFAEHLGLRLGEMHRLLAAETDDPAFAPEPAGRTALEAWRNRIGSRMDAALKGLAARLDTLAERDREKASFILDRRAAIGSYIERLIAAGEGARLHRIHGDFHLGQVLVAQGDAVIIDFEGEPALPVEARRAKDSGWRDVAGILRSLDYAVRARRRPSQAAGDSNFGRLADLFQARVPQTLLDAYRKGAGIDARGAEAERDDGLLRLFLLEKAAYEVTYEMDNRPDWLPIALGSLARLVADLPPDAGA